MSFNVEQKENTMVVSITGELDDHVAKGLREKLDFFLLRKEIINLVFDLSELTFMDSAGIGLLIGRYKQVKERGGKSVVVIGTSHSKRILKMSGVLNIFLEAQSITDAFEIVGVTSLA
ncbi:MAG: anti-sigma factor antagonist [Eubacteriaceae bacterium]|nr:anti-sigma factor antagonist [Eubacteriaceae bacterium]